MWFDHIVSPCPKSRILLILWIFILDDLYFYGFLYFCGWSNRILMFTTKYWISFDVNSASRKTKVKWRILWQIPPTLPFFAIRMGVFSTRLNFFLIGIISTFNWPWKTDGDYHSSNTTVRWTFMYTMWLLAVMYLLMYLYYWIMRGSNTIMVNRIMEDKLTVMVYLWSFKFFCIGKFM